MKVITDEVRTENSSTRSLLWLAGAIGAGVGVAAIAYSRRPRSRWERARDRASQLVNDAREEVKPWMGVAAGTAAAGTALAVYSRRRNQPSGWERTGRRAGEIATQVGTQVRPWANLAISAAISLASAAYAKKAARRNIRGVSAETAQTVNSLAERGLQVLRRVRAISEQTGKLYPRVRRLIA